MLIGYKIAVLMLLYFAVFYLFLVDPWRHLLVKVARKYRNQVAYWTNIVMGSIHILFSLYIIGCVVHFVWNL
jgi:hypothetical protein